MLHWISTLQHSLGSKKDLNTKDFLPKSIISAVTRKRKKCLSTYLPGSSTDEDSEHEPVKASNYRGGEEGEEDRGQEEAAEGEHIISKKDKRDEKGNGVKAGETTEAKDSLVEGEEAEKDKGEGLSSGTKKFQRESRQRTNLAGTAPQLRPNSFLYSHHQNHATYPRHPPTTNPPSHLRPHNLARGHPMVPLWLSPTRLPSLYQSSSFHGTQQPDWNQPVPVRYRKSRGGRTRAMSMNLDFELGWNEDRVRGWRAEKVEVIRVIEAGPGQHGCVGVPQGSILDPRSILQTDPVPRIAQEAPLSSSSSGWIDQRSPGSSTVVLRRSALGPQDKTRAWRRHTVVV